MMVTACEEPIDGDVSVKHVLQKLQTKAIGTEEKLLVYQSLADEFKKDDINVTLHVLGHQTKQLAQQFGEDIQSDHRDLNQAALQIVGLCLYYEEVSHSFSGGDANSLLKALCSTILKTEDKNTCTRALWCLSRQNLPSKKVQEELHTILCALEHVLQKAKFDSMTVEHESVDLISRLLDQVPEPMSFHTSRWGPLLYPFVLHSAPKIRDKAFMAMSKGMPSLLKHQASLVPVLVSVVKSKLVTDMADLFSRKQEMYTLKVWKMFVQLLGKGLHKGGSLINLMLRVVEQGFKHGFSDVKKASFEAWKVLIDNFALDLDILGNAKRLKLLMQPFLATSIKQKVVASSKFDAWWHLATKLGPKLALNFEVVLAPLLQFSLGLVVSGVNLSVSSTPSSGGSRLGPLMRPGLPLQSPVTPHINLASPFASGGSAQNFRSMRLRGVIVLGYVLGVNNIKELLNQSDPLLPDALSHPVIASPSVFIKMAAIIFAAVKDVALLHQDIINDEALFQLFASLVKHVDLSLQSASKKESSEMFTSFLYCLQSILKGCSLSPSIQLTFLDCLKCLPTKVLSSSAYLSGNGGCVLRGTPTLFLLEVLFSANLLKASSEERYFLLLEHLVQCGMTHQTSVLEFTQSFVHIVDKAAEDIPNKESLWRIWSILANPLLSHILKTNEVNQGDSLDHNFTAMVVFLILPIQRIFLHEIPVPTMKSLLRTWSELFEAFSRCASLVTTAEENQCCQDLCTKIHHLFSDKDLSRNLRCMEALFQVCKAVVDSIVFSAISHQPHSVQSPMTPNKWSKKKHKPLGNISALVKLLCHMMNAFHKLRANQKTSFLSGANQGYLSNWSSITSTCAHCVTTLFTHIGQSPIVRLLMEKVANSLGGFYVTPNGFPQGDIYQTNILPKLDKMWQDILTSLQSRYQGSYNSSFLVAVETLLQAAFLNPCHSIRNHTLLFWNVTFAKNGHLTYSDELKICLQKVKEKTAIHLPGWVDIDIEDNSSVQIVESEPSQSLMEPPILLPKMGSPSPHKMHGSFLNRQAEAKHLFIASSPLKASPLRPPELSNFGKLTTPSPVKNKKVARRKLNIDEESTQDFVFIAPSPKKKITLTEHQREVLSTKRVIPALYCDLEQSQDTSLFTDLFAKTQSQSSDTSPVEDSAPLFPPTLNNNTVEEIKEDVVLASEKAEDTGVRESEGIIEKDDQEKKNSKKVSFVDERKEADGIDSFSEETGYFLEKMDETINSLKEVVSQKKKIGSLQSDANSVELLVNGDEMESVIVDSDGSGAQNVHRKEKVNNLDVLENQTLEQTSEERQEKDAVDESEERLKKNAKKESGESKDEWPILDEEVKCVAETQFEEIADSICTPTKSSACLHISQTSRSLRISPSLEMDTVDLSICDDDQIPPSIKITTPILKIAKMDVSRVREWEQLEKQSTLDLIKANDRSPVVCSPTDKVTPRETPRFRRYKSEEIPSGSPSLRVKVRRWHSFEDLLNKEDVDVSFGSGSDTSMISVIHNTDKDCTLVEKVDLDGIEPLGQDEEEVEKQEVQTLSQGDNDGSGNMDGNDVDANLSLNDSFGRGRRARKPKHFPDFVTSQTESFAESSQESQGESVSEIQESANDLPLNADNPTSQRGRKRSGRMRKRKEENVKEGDEKTQEKAKIEISNSEEVRDAMQAEPESSDMIDMKLSELSKEIRNALNTQDDLFSEGVELEKDIDIEKDVTSQEWQSFGNNSTSETENQKCTEESESVKENIDQHHAPERKMQKRDILKKEKLSRKKKRKGKKNGILTVDTLIISDSQESDKQHKVTSFLEKTVESHEKDKNDESFSTDDELPLTELKKESCSTLQETGKTEKNNHNLLSNVENKTEREELSAKGEEATSTLQKTPHSPKIRQKLSDRFKKSRQVSPKSKKAKIHLKSVKKNGMKENSKEISQRLLRSAKMGPVHTRLRSKKLSPKMAAKRKVIKRTTANEEEMASENEKVEITQSTTPSEKKISVRIPETLEQISSTSQKRAPTKDVEDQQKSDGVDSSRACEVEDVVYYEAVKDSQDFEETDKEKCEADQFDSISSQMFKVTQKEEMSVVVEKIPQINIMEAAALQHDNKKEDLNEMEGKDVCSDEGNDEVMKAEVKSVSEKNVEENNEKEQQESVDEETLISVAKGNEETIGNSEKLSELMEKELIKPSGITQEGVKSPDTSSPIIPFKFAPKEHSSPVRRIKFHLVEEGSPETSEMPTTYSPSASPSGGILKKRNENGENSPSPTNKMRRVKFAEAISTKEIEGNSPKRKRDKSDLRISSKLRTHSPLVTTTPSKVIAIQSKYITTPSRSSTSKTTPNESGCRKLGARSSDSFRSPLLYNKPVFSRRLCNQRPLSTPPTQGSPSSLNSSYDEEAESQEPICPDLVGCKAPVEEILYQLTSSMWARGLSKLIHAKNIFTIGQLCSLTPMEVQSLPIRSPKVSHLKWVLAQYQQRSDVKAATTAEKDVDSVGAKNGRVTENKEQTEAVSAPSVSGLTSLPSSSSLKRKREQADDDEKSASLSRVSHKKLKLLTQLAELDKEFKEAMMDDIPTEQLFKALGHINALTEAVMGGLKTKCHSPP